MILQQEIGKLSSCSVYIRKSPVFFEDAENDAMTVMLKPCEWEPVNKSFAEEAGRAGS